ncbi:MAG: glycosyltransferase family 39 protein [Chloroflexi bacterium]|nr:glycosyltransferase family 39 protein [Chloroflexota bacterium]
MDLRHRTRKNLAFGLTLLAIVLAGTALRLYDLGGHSVDLDESATWDVIRQPTLGAMLDSVADYGQAPFSFVITYAITQVFGESEIPLRLSSALAGILSIPAVYLVGRRLFGYAEGLMAAGLTAALWQPLYYSQYARPYSWSLLLSALAAYYWLGLLADVRAGRPMQRRSAALYVAFGLAAIYNHYLAALMQAWQAPALLAAILAERGALRQRAKEWVALYFGYALGFLPWLPTFLSQMGDPSQHEWIREPTPGDFTELLAWAFTDATYRLRNLPEALLLGALLMFVALAVALMRGLLARRRGATARRPSGEFVLVFWLAAPTLLLYWVSHTIKPLWVPRYLIFLMPAFALLAARGLGGLPWSRRYPRLAGQILLALAGAGLVGYFAWDVVVQRHYYSQRDTEHTREVVQIIETFREFAPDALSVVCGHSRQYEYYTVRLGRPDVTDLRACGGREFRGLDARLDEAGTQTFILSQLHWRIGEQTIAGLEDRYCLVDRARFPDGGVWLFTGRDDDACPNP